MSFRPEEVLFSPTSACNLSCPHCSSLSTGPVKRLPIKAALGFLKGCARLGVRRVGFTGGEPFLEPGTICDIVSSAVREGLLFDRIMTNGVWWPTVRRMRSVLARVRAAGYDGTICVSFDAFHAQDPARVGRFIEEASAVWRRPDAASIASVAGAMEERTTAMLRSLASSLGGRLGVSPAGNFFIKSSGVFARVDRITLVPLGRAAGLIDPWDGRWFRSDRCSGPGNALFVLPDGDVKPCCGFASDCDALTIGNIKRDDPADVIKNMRANAFASSVFGRGLDAIRKALMASGVTFPGKTSNHCFFCGYVLRSVPGETLKRCLRRRP
jgi:hypothetical protein